ncbi:MAG TPA: TetR/AcrR family transcriptional regulator [Anaerolineae bacterium]|nr:TetR/AcrR family transcriptional regulator [Anaerolineae bacterium]
MYHIKDDQRSIRSSQMLYDALVTLMATQPFDTIKVSELTREAQVGRATFYRHFDTTEDILRWQCDLTLDNLIQFIIQYLQSQPDITALPLLKPLLRYFYVHDILIKQLIQANRIDILQEQFLQRQQRFHNQLKHLFKIPDEYIQYILILRAVAAIQILIQWIENDKTPAPDELADAISRIAGQMLAQGKLL